MNATSDDSQARLRRTVYTLLILLGTGAMLGRILAVDAVDKTAVQTHLERKGRHELLRRPFLSGNDRSRWCTVRALVEEEMHVYDVDAEGNLVYKPYAIDKVIEDRDRWDTIDKVKHDGHFYSSKPTLFPTLMAAEYWLIRQVAPGMSLESHPFVLGRFMLITINLLPLLFYFWLLTKLVERFGTTDWGKMFVMAAAVFGTFLSTFAVTINNHLIAAVCTVGALYAVVRIWYDGDTRYRWFAMAGFFAAMMAANELPALSLFALLSAALLWKFPARAAAAYLPIAVVVAAAALGTNWIAHRSLIPAYMHRGGSDPADNWYDYDGSYWRNPQGPDQGEASAGVYVMHVLVGHHGVFSLTPIWILSIVGMFIWLCRERQPWELALAIGAVSAVCLVFYLTRPLHYRNYGGMTSGLRWMFWLAPAWLVLILPAVDEMARRLWTRVLALVLLAVSVLSASYPTWNPWTHPWLWDFWKYMGWFG